jgi:hypothetical protein
MGGGASYGLGRRYRRTQRPIIGGKPLEPGGSRKGRRFCPGTIGLGSKLIIVTSVIEQPRLHGPGCREAVISRRGTHSLAPHPNPENSGQPPAKRLAYGRITLEMLANQPFCRKRAYLGQHQSNHALGCGRNPKPYTFNRRCDDSRGFAYLETLTRYLLAISSPSAGWCSSVLSSPFWRRSTAARISCSSPAARSSA